MAVETGHQPNRMYLDQDGALHLNGAAFFLADETTNLKIARGSLPLDGSNPTPVATGLNTIISAVCTLQGSVAPGLGTSVLTFTVSGGTLNINGWMPTSAANPTLIASTGTESLSWIAIGT